MKHPRSRLFAVVAVALLITIAAGCSKSPQQAYTDAMNHLKDTKQAVQKAGDDVDKAQAKVDAANKKLTQAKNRLELAKKKVAEARQRVDKVVNDDVLFRTLQKKMLENDAFSDAAISVTVNHRVVTLAGSVPDQKTRKKAVNLAREQTGVAKVVDRLEIPEKQSDASGEKMGGGLQKDEAGKKSGSKTPNAST